MGYHRKKRETDGQKERERGREDAVLYENGGKNLILIDVQNVETTGERCCHLSWRTALNSSLCTFIGMKHTSPTCTLNLCVAYQCIWGWQHLQKPSSQMAFHLYFLLFWFRSGAPPMYSGDWWSANIAHRSPAAHDSFKRVHDWCKAGWRRPGDPPPQIKILTTPVEVGYRIMLSNFTALVWRQGWVRECGQEQWIALPPSLSISLPPTLPKIITNEMNAEVDGQVSK